MHVVCMHVVCMYACMYACMFVCLCMFYLCIYIYIYNRKTHQNDAQKAAVLRLEAHRIEFSKQCLNWVIFWLIPSSGTVQPQLYNLRDQLLIL